jgi:hypothetical protein
MNEEMLSQFNISEDARQIIEDADAAIIITDAVQSHQPILYVNKKFLEMTGYDYDECIGYNCRFLQGQETSKSSKHQMKQAILNEESTRIVMVNYRKNGEKFYNEINLAPVYDDKGRVIYYLSLQFDVTHQYESYKALEAGIIAELRNIQNV